jgi:hypothetical protein
VTTEGGVEIHEIFILPSIDLWKEQRYHAPAVEEQNKNLGGKKVW